MNNTYHLSKLSKLEEVKQLVAVFGKAFEHDYQVSDEYLNSLINDSDAIVIGAFDPQGIIVGGLVGFELRPIHGSKEIYLYDIAVDPQSQKRGIGRQLIQSIKQEALQRNVQTIFVEAEAIDEGAVAFYRALGGEEVSVNHFNFTVE